MPIKFKTGTGIIVTGKATAAEPNGPDFCEGNLLTPYTPPEPYKAYKVVSDLRDMYTTASYKSTDKQFPGRPLMPRAETFTVSLTIHEKLILDEDQSDFPRSREQKEVYVGSLTLRWKKHQTPKLLQFKQIGFQYLKEFYEYLEWEKEECPTEQEVIFEDTFNAKVVLKFHVCPDDVDSEESNEINGEITGLDELIEAPWPWNRKKVSGTFKAENPLVAAEGRPPEEVDFRIYDLELTRV